ncbi:MAG: type 2 lantipeptide synthetase LanM family protein [Acidobacteriota bacterium]|nr:type 2 lantipeptide synthetase LanM family protein [Acidobacteriota bacterium]
MTGGIGRICVRARSLRERIALPGACLPPDLADRWCAKAAGGNREVFREMLRRDGIDPDTFIASGDVGGNAEAGDSWTSILHAILDDAPLSREPLGQIEGDPVPFQEALQPLVNIAARMLDRRARSQVGMVSAPARHSLERSLLKRLSLHAAPALLDEFEKARPAALSVALRWLGSSVESGTGVWYRGFVSRVQEEQWSGIFNRFPALARILCTVVECWVESIAEFLERFALDRDEITLAFGVAGLERAACIAMLDAGRSDPHHGGRTVILLTLADGTGMVYKPRDVSAEAAYREFAEWCASQGAPFSPRAPRVLCRGGYGWIERVARRDLKVSVCVAAYYRRAGALLAVLHALGATDAHHENVIASGEYPVLVDAETLLTPESGLPREQGLAACRLARSVRRTGMLPVRIGPADSALSYDVSALGGARGRTPSIPVWKDINSDTMRVEYEAARIEDDCLPTLHGQPMPAAGWISEIIEGFSAMFTWLVVRKQMILAPDGPLAEFHGVVTRFVYRPTAIYAMILHAGSSPRRLEDGTDRSLETELLARLLLDRRTPREHWEVFAAERRALENLDVPWLSLRSDSRDLELGPGHRPIRGFFATASFDELRARIQRLDLRDLREEIGIVRASLGEQPQPVPAISSVPEMGQMEMLGAAESIAATIAASSIGDENGSAEWYGLTVTDAAGEPTLAPLGPSLYNGLAGIALFFAALDRVRGTVEYRDLARGALRAATAQALANAGLPIGAGTGLGSVLYSIVRVAEFAHAPELLDGAAALAARLTPSRIAAETESDVLSGCAGAILALLTFHDATRESGALASARAAGNRLLGGPASWNSRGCATLTGMSHGAAGISYALLRLAEATGEECYRAAASQGIGYEARIFSEAEANWCDLRPSAAGHSGFRMSWCHGAPGIGLARLGGLRMLDTPQVRRDVEASLIATSEKCFGSIDHLCCGVFGRIETLLVGASVLERPGLKTTAMEYAARSFTRGLSTGTSAPALTPGFFRGLSGIGYEFLRMAYPDELPSVLLWR